VKECDDEDDALLLQVPACSCLTAAYAQLLVYFTMLFLLHSYPRYPFLQRSQCI
jgi:hypothetical protein